jgi:hypothetical protein
MHINLPFRRSYMNREVAVRLFAALIAALGAWVLVQSTTLGLSAFPSIVSSVGGSLSGSEVEVAYQSSVAAFRTMGAVLLGVGLWRVLQPWPKEK